MVGSQNLEAQQRIKNTFKQHMFGMRVFLSAAGSLDCSDQSPSPHRQMSLCHSALAGNPSHHEQPYCRIAQDAHMKALSAKNQFVVFGNENSMWVLQVRIVRECRITVDKPFRFLHQSKEGFLRLHDAALAISDLFEDLRVHKQLP